MKNHYKNRQMKNQSQSADYFGLEKKLLGSVHLIFEILVCDGLNFRMLGEILCHLKTFLDINRIFESASRTVANPRIDEFVSLIRAKDSDLSQEGRRGRESSGTRH